MYVPFRHTVHGSYTAFWSVCVSGVPRSPRPGRNRSGGVTGELPDPSHVPPPPPPFDPLHFRRHSPLPLSSASFSARTVHRSRCIGRALICALRARRRRSLWGTGRRRHVWCRRCAPARTRIPAPSTLRLPSGGSDLTEPSSADLARTRRPRPRALTSSDRTFLWHLQTPRHGSETPDLRLASGQRIYTVERVQGIGSNAE